MLLQRGPTTMYLLWYDYEYMYCIIPRWTVPEAAVHIGRVRGERDVAACCARERWEETRGEWCKQVIGMHPASDENGGWINNKITGSPFDKDNHSVRVKSAEWRDLRCAVTMIFRRHAYVRVTAPSFTSRLRDDATLPLSLPTSEAVSLCARAPVLISPRRHTFFSRVKTGSDHRKRQNALPFYHFDISPEGSLSWHVVGAEGVNGEFEWYSTFI